MFKYDRETKERLKATDLWLTGKIIRPGSCLLDLSQHTILVINIVYLWVKARMTPRYPDVLPH